MRWVVLWVVLLITPPTFVQRAPLAPGSALLTITSLPDHAGVTVTWATDPLFLPSCLYWHETDSSVWIGPLAPCATSGTRTILQHDPALIPGRQLVLLCGDAVWQETCILTRATIPYPFTIYLPIIIHP